MTASANLEPVPDLQPVVPQWDSLYPYNIALIIDNVVYSTYNVDGQQAAQFLSQPKFVQYSGTDARIGWIYDEETNTFSQPDPVGQ